jgi:hypothetical protein
MVAALLALAWIAPAAALPSFARQTGQPCGGCHVGNFGPQLTSFGREFKLRGYTLRAGDSSTLPLSAMLVASYTHTASDQAEPAGPHDGTNDNFSVQELSLFGAGRISEHVGMFAQATYSDIDRHLALDNVEIRYAHPFTRGEHSGVFGVSLNNSPGLSDLRHTQGVWRFPFMASELAPSPEAAPLIDEGLGQQVVGADAYISVDSRWYAALGLYDTLSRSFLADINADYGGRSRGLTPYWRVLWQGPGGFALGASGLNARIQPDSALALDNRYDDVGIDASWEKNVGDGDMFTVNASYMHERQRLDAALASGEAERSGHSLNSSNFNASYYIDNTYGLTFAWFDRSGSRDALLYPDSRIGSPDARGEILQADWTPFGKANSWNYPWLNLRLGLQYTRYERFQGSSRDYDGNGRDAGDNNTLFLFAWWSI